jgi:hypothetical protein
VYASGSVTVGSIATLGIVQTLAGGFNPYITFSGQSDGSVACGPTTPGLPTTTTPATTAVVNDASSGDGSESSGEISGWVVAVIVFVALFLLIVGALVFTTRRRRAAHADMDIARSTAELSQVQSGLSVVPSRPEVKGSAWLSGGFAPDGVVLAEMQGTASASSTDQPPRNAVFGAFVADPALNASFDERAAHMWGPAYYDGGDEFEAVGQGLATAVATGR